jgi:hypothetical protein
VSLSTDNNAAIVLAGLAGKAPEMLFPPEGWTASQERQELKLAYPDFVPGKKRRISAAERDIYRYYMAAAAHYDEQKSLAVNRMRALLADAEYGYTGRVIFVERRRFSTAGYLVPAGFTDALYPVRN